MLRVGLTGGLGSGKSTVLRMLVERGAHGLSADEIGRALMEPGTAVFGRIVRHFGDGVLGADGRLDRGELARLAFAGGRVEELNAIVHPATIARQAELAAEILRGAPHAIVVVESALLFETRHGGAGAGEGRGGTGWRDRFDRVMLVRAPDGLKIERFVERSGAEDRTALEDEARRRLSRMIPDEDKAGACDFVIVNDGTLAELEGQVERVWLALLAMERAGSEA